MKLLTFYYRETGKFYDNLQTTAITKKYFLKVSVVIMKIILKIQNSSDSFKRVIYI